MFSIDVVLLGFIASTTVALYVFNSRKTARHKLPPGPSGIPFFGNIFQVNVLKPYPQFRQWALEHGDIFYLRLGPQNVIVLNTPEAANELLVKRSSNYSSRASPHVAQDLVSDGQRMVFLPFAKEWKTVRKSLQSAIGFTPSKAYRRIQELESRAFMYDLLNHGDQSIVEKHHQGPNGEVPERHWFGVIRRFTTSVVINVAYGQRAHHLYNNPYLHKIYDVMVNFTQVAQPGNYFADAFPILRKLPDFLAPWRIEGRKMHQWEMDLWGKYFDEGKAATEQGINRHGFINQYLRARMDAGVENAPGNGLTDKGWMRDKMIAYTGATILEAGSDTTASTMQSFVLLMLTYPHVLERAREEIDSLVGMERMPDFDDMDRLPYFVACLKETFRRRPAIIMGVPHKAEEDDVYDGYLIPKGSTVFGNVWAIHMDPDRFPNPTAFTPERYYEKDKSPRWASGPDSNGRDHFVFGWGRRFCQGSYIAEASLFIALSRLVWGMDFYAPTDPTTGKPKIPDIDDEAGTWTEGFVTGPKMYDVGFKPRTDKHAQVMRKYFEDAQLEWQMMGMPGDER
ncbi:cytochrome P450 [Laetiporus sulphureus 93-53]|uniref:Cytochrome P450 n=1 Tax=Laetiporus sulphureus 93-53 TaxID=1314785 RepID=A0A165IGR2_9APHY|nr:cytochrome P450 [Laetiporus sulphureus 93-53]KZT13049.1 cytochrome P450 [Laetiporus sulphureus 93-53]